MYGKKKLEETYVEESAFFVKSGEEECSLKAREELRSKGKEVRGGEEEGGETQKSKTLCESQKAFVEPVFDNESVQACGFAVNKSYAHAELARIVVDIESMNTQKEPNLGLGQERKIEAQEGEV
ncbi:hypothetical protein VNO80_13191 [Phaseolus coccineus]|uniref:Uncharacterized protein n=1 Tax=Phaseolus coccineus TaxID=3886 RepID=A0AAN9N5U5_PHACN